MKFQNKIKSFLKFLFIILISVVLNLLLTFFIGFKNFYTFLFLLFFTDLFWKLLIKIKVLKTKNKKNFIFCLFFILFIYFSIVLINDKELRINLSFETYNFLIKQKYKIESFFLEEKYISKFEDNEDKSKVINVIFPKLYPHLSKEELIIVEGPIKKNKYLKIEESIYKLNVEERFYKLKKGFIVKVTANNLISQIMMFDDEKYSEKMKSLSDEKLISKSKKYLKLAFPNLKGELLFMKKYRRLNHFSIWFGVKEKIFIRNIICIDMYIDGSFSDLYIKGDISDIKSPLEI